MSFSRTIANKIISYLFDIQILLHVRNKSLESTLLRLIVLEAAYMLIVGPSPKNNLSSQWFHEQSNAKSIMNPETNTLNKRISR